MKIEDLSQNLTGRIGTIQIIAFILLTLLGIRLYFLQIVRGDELAKKAENQRIRKIPIPAPRGAIFDRNGKILVDSISQIRTAGSSWKPRSVTPSYVIVTKDNVDSFMKQHAAG